VTTVPIPLDRIFIALDRIFIDRFGIGSPNVMTATERALERSLAVEHGRLVCPRRGSVLLATCDDCHFLCGAETEPPSVICSYPIPARETFGTRSRHSEAVRIALRHQLQRT